MDPLFIPCNWGMREEKPEWSRGLVIKLTIFKDKVWKFISLGWWDSFLFFKTFRLQNITGSDWKYNVYVCLYMCACVCVCVCVCVLGVETSWEQWLTADKIGSWCQWIGSWVLLHQWEGLWEVAPDSQGSEESLEKPCSVTFIAALYIPVTSFPSRSWNSGPSSPFQGFLYQSSSFNLGSHGLHWDPGTTGKYNLGLTGSLEMDN